MELDGRRTFYTDNDDFFGGKTLSQAPLYSVQAHLIYGFRSGIWASLDATYFVGGGRPSMVCSTPTFSRTGGSGDLGAPGGPGEFDQALCQQWGVCTHRRQLRPYWRRSCATGVCRRQSRQSRVSASQRSAGMRPANALMTMALAMSIRKAPTTGTMMNACGA